MGIEVSLYLVMMTLLGAFLYRARGAGWSWWPLRRPWNQLVVVLPIIFVLFFLASVTLISGPTVVSLLCATVFSILSVVTAGMGHGDYMRLNRHADQYTKQDNEEVGYLLRPLFPDLTIGGSRWAYEFVGLSLTGLAITLPLVIALLIFGFYGLAAIAVIGGLLKGMAYEIGWRISDRGTEYGEWFFGGVLWASLAIIILVLHGVI
jgi:hypothetical protein